MFAMTCIKTLCIVCTVNDTNIHDDGDFPLLRKQALDLGNDVLAVREVAEEL